MERVLVAGGAGFIGSHLCESLLKNGKAVIAIDNLSTGNKDNISPLLQNPNFTFYEHDVTESLAGLEGQLGTLSAVFHLASPASPNHHSKISYHALPMETMMINTMGTLALLRLAEKQHAKFLFTSTSEVYGDPLVHPQPESYRGNVSTTGPRSIYDESKRFGETLVAYFWREKGLDARIARVFNTYGPHMQPADMRMIVVFINQALKGEPITIFGDGKQTRSLCYVDDTVEGLIRLMYHDNTNKEIVNIGSEDEHTVLAYAGMVKKLTNSQSDIVFSENLPEDDPLKRKADISKAKSLLQWEPQIGLEQGIQKMIEYCKSI